MHYLDIRINGAPSPEPQERSARLEKRGADTEDIPLAGLSSRALSILHGAFAQRLAVQDAQPYALALPNGLEVLRVFSAGRDELDALADNTEKHPFMRDYTSYGRVRQVLITDETRWVEYRRFRIPNRNSIAVDGHEDRNGARREASIARASMLPHFVISSKSTGQRARIFVERQEWAKETTGILTPDSWGLSRLSARFAVPEV